MNKFLRYLLLILGILLVVNLFLVPLIEPGMIYFPMKELEGNPSSVGLKYEDIYLKTSDGVLIHGWFIENPLSQKVVLVFHGNGGNISHRLDLVKLLHTLPADVFIIDYHGYGKSGGKPSEKNLYLDAEAAYDHLIDQKKYKSQQIVVLGSSLGGAVATELAVREKIGALILRKTFTSAQEMAVRMNPLYRRPIIWIRSDFDNLKKIQEVAVPVLIIHSKDDELIPYQMAVVLYEKANLPKQLLLLEGFRHNDFISSPEYVDSLRMMVK